MSLTTAVARTATNYDNPRSLGARLRARRIGPLVKMIDDAHRRYGRVDIIDVGGTRTYWRILSQRILAEKKATITVVNLPGAPLPDDEEHFRYAEGDGCNLADYEDGTFHIAHSNSVIEHVGNWDNMVSFANELRRVARSYFVQTPNFWFPVEPHFITPLFHWLPQSLRVSMIMRFNLGHFHRRTDVDSAVRVIEKAPRLLDRKMVRELFEDARIITERFFLLPKSLIAVREES